MSGVMDVFFIYGVVDVWCDGCLVWWMSAWWMLNNHIMMYRKGLLVQIISLLLRALISPQGKQANPVWL